MTMQRTMTGLVVAALMALQMPAVLADEGEVPQPNEAFTTKVDLLADFVAGDEATEEDTAAAAESVAALRTSGIGWGALFKIYKLAAAMGVDAEALLDEIGPDGEFDFGALRNALTEAEREAYDSSAKNFGTLVAAAHKAGASETKAAKMAERDARKAAKMAERDARKAARGQGGN
jgi:hypothetical protein